MSGIGIGDWLQEEQAAKELGVDPAKLRAVPKGTKKSIVGAVSKKLADRKAAEEAAKKAAEEKAQADKEKAALDALGVSDPIIAAEKAQIDSRVGASANPYAALGQQSDAQRMALEGRRTPGAAQPQRRRNALANQYGQQAQRIRGEFNETKEDLALAGDLQRTGIADAATIAGERGRAEAAAIRGYQEEMRSRDIELDARRQAHREALAQAQKRYDSAAAEEVDTQRFRKENRGKFIMASLAMFFTDRAAIMTGNQPGQGKWLEMVNQQVEEDIAEQRRQVESGKQAASNEYSNLIQQWGDETQAENIMRARRYQSLQNSLAEIKGEFQGSEQIAAADNAMGQLEQAQAVIKQSVLGKENQILAQQAQATAKLMGGGARKGKTVGSADVRQIAELKGARNMMDGLYKSFKDDTGAMSWLTKHLPGTGASNYEAQRRIAAQVIGGIVEGGKLTDSDYERYLEMIPKANTTAEEGRNKIRALDKILAEKRDSAIQGFGLGGYDVSGYQQGPTLGTLGAPVN